MRFMDLGAEFIRVVVMTAKLRTHSPAGERPVLP